MSEVANIYNNGPISPVARIKDNLAIWTNKGEWVPYQVEFIEGIPRSSPYIIDLVSIAGQATIGANGQVAKQAVVVLQMNDNELLHLRWAPLNDVEGAMWELSNVARYAPYGGQARVAPETEEHDPYLATTTFFILGKQKDIQVGAFNLRAVAQPVALFAFWGFRYIVNELGKDAFNKAITYLPAQGR